MNNLEHLWTGAGILHKSPANAELHAGFNLHQTFTHVSAAFPSRCWAHSSGPAEAPWRRQQRYAKRASRKRLAGRRLRRRLETDRATADSSSVRCHSRRNRELTRWSRLLVWLLMHRAHVGAITSEPCYRRKRRKDKLLQKNRRTRQIGMVLENVETGRNHQEIRIAFGRIPLGVLGRETREIGEE